MRQSIPIIIILASEIFHEIVCKEALKWLKIRSQNGQKYGYLQSAVGDDINN
jgi:hypothetical protein